MKLHIDSKRYNTELNFDKTVDQVTVSELQKLIYNHFPKLTLDRQRIKFGDKVLTNAKQEDTLSSFGIQDGDKISLKDLGPQISWKTVFLVEYLGPLVIHPIFYYFSNVIYRSDFNHSDLQFTVMALFVLHFLKREYETLFVHRFSHGTMPFFNLFKNSFHYHVLSGFLPAYFYYSPSNSGSSNISNFHYYACIALFLFAEFSNFITHITLRNLRKPGSKERKIPYGYGFDWVSCPNYLFEIIAWFAVALLTNHWSIWLFLAVSTGQMYLWAIKKHKQYKKEFKDYPKGRKALFPLIV